MIGRVKGMYRPVTSVEIRPGAVAHPLIARTKKQMLDMRSERGFT
jgi:hypothetical protein